MEPTKSEWISVKDKLPEARENNEFESELVLTYYGSWGEYMIQYYWVKANHWADTTFGDKVTHWQPLPKPPKN